MERILSKAREEMRVPLLHGLKSMEEALAKEPQERRERIRREWVLEESGHNIPIEAPQVVVDAIRQVVEQAHRR